MKLYHEPTLPTDLKIAAWMIGLVLIGLTLAVFAPLDNDETKYIRTRNRVQTSRSMRLIRGGQRPIAKRKTA